MILSQLIYAKPNNEAEDRNIHPATALVRSLTFLDDWQGSSTKVELKNSSNNPWTPYFGTVDSLS